MNKIAANLESTKQMIAEAAIKCGRAPNSVSLLAVSKGHGAEAIVSALQAGHLLFGENYIQEAKQKIAEVGESTASFHFIGHLQRNKVKYAVKLFDSIQTVDKLSLAEDIAFQAEKLGKVQNILIQVNLLGDEAKSGITPEATEQLAKDILTFKNLKLNGLMYIGRLYEDADVQQKEIEFRSMAEFRKELEQRLSIPLPELSMGMSSDFELAIQHGASMVRVGSAIFGERVY